MTVRLQQAQSKLLNRPSGLIVSLSKLKNMTITTEQIKELRDKTGVSVMQCKKALEEAGGDEEKALIILRKKSGDIAAKKADRTFNAGTVQSYVHGNSNVGVLVELNCETDFVARNPDFVTLARDIAMHIAAVNPKFINKDEISENDKQKATEVFASEVEGKPEAVKAKILEGKLNSYFGEMVLLDQPFIKNPELTINGLIQGAIQKFGEKIQVGRFVRFSVLGR
jgi:elongation factor Ts